MQPFLTPDLLDLYWYLGGQNLSVAIKQLKCAHAKLTCALSAVYTPDSKGVAPKMAVKHLYISKVAIH